MGIRGTQNPQRFFFQILPLSRVHSTPKTWLGLADLHVLSRGAVQTSKRNEIYNVQLGGGFKQSFFTLTWEDDPIWLIFFKMG